MKQNSKKWRHKVIAVFYDTKTINPDTKEKTDAIGVFAEHRNGRKAYNFYYPYKLSDQKELSVSASFGSIASRKIFRIDSSVSKKNVRTDSTAGKETIRK